MPHGFRPEGCLPCVWSALLVVGCGSGVVSLIDDAGAGGGSNGHDGPNFSVADVPASDGPPFVPGVGGAACAMQTTQAERLPLDLYIMMDSSSSMEDRTAAGLTKWDAVKQAMSAFLDDPKSAGLGVGLQFFPQAQAGAPRLCSNDQACGAFGPCFGTHTCAPSDFVAPCAGNGDCQKGQMCIPLGFCQKANEYCVPVGQPCGQGATRDTCTAVNGYCLGREVCTTAAYAKPAVPVSALPAAANSLKGTMAGHMTDGYTPTAPALGGALEYARSRAVANPDRRIAVLLATDGLPTNCMPTEIAGVADIAKKALADTPSVSTFVVGVFARPEAQVATTNLTAIAQAGGTGRAFVINTDQNVTQEFLAALNQIRSDALPCQYKIPPATMGQIDFGKVNVQFTPGAGQAATIPNVKNLAACDPARGGWYYDQDPASGAPTTLSVCAATCAKLRADPGGRVDVVLGCKTVLIE